MDVRRPDLEAFASLWTALRVTYEGTNISRTVARLLHMYQPEDGVLAYERLLKTLFVLLEDFDGDCLRLLVSMVPPPADVPEDARDEVFHRATGFVKVNASVVYRRAATSASERNEAGSPLPTRETLRQSCGRISRQQENIPPGMASALSSMQRNLPGSSNQPQAQNASQVFRGFPPNEIHSTQSRAQTINTFCGPAKHGCFARKRSLEQQCRPAAPGGRGFCPGQNVLQSPFVQVRKSAPQDLYLKTIDNRYVKVPVSRISGFRPYQGDQLRDSQGILNKLTAKLQDDRLKSKEETAASPVVGQARSDREMEIRTAERAVSGIFSSELGSGSNALRAPGRNFSNGDVPPSRDMALLEPGKSHAEVPTRETREMFQEEVRKRQRAIQEDIYKMDVVRPVEKRATAVQSRESPTGLTIREELRKSFERYLKRAETKESFDEAGSMGSTVQETVAASHNLPNVLSVSQTGKSKEWLPAGTTKEHLAVELHSARGASALSEISVSRDTANLSTNDQQPEEETESKVARKKKPDLQRRLKSERLVQKVPIRSYGASAPASGESTEAEAGARKIVTESLFGCSGAEPAAGSRSLGRAATMADVAAIKRQYYDALLSIQRAKAAVAHASATTGNPSSVDMYYYGYLQQRMLRSSRLAQQRSMQSLHGSPWIGSSEWNASILGHSSRSRPHQTSPCQSLWPPELRSLPRDPRESSGPVQGSQDVLPQPKPTGARRRKLEEIVGKLKETEGTIRRGRLDM